MFCYLWVHCCSRGVHHISGYADSRAWGESGPPEGGEPISVERSGHSQQKLLKGYRRKCSSEMAEFQDQTFCLLLILTTFNVDHFYFWSLFILTAFILTTFHFNQLSPIWILSTFHFDHFSFWPLVILTTCYFDHLSPLLILATFNFDHFLF